MEVEEEEGEKRDAVVMSWFVEGVSDFREHPRQGNGQDISYPGAGCDRRIRPYNGSGRRGRVAGQIN